MKLHHTAIIIALIFGVQFSKANSIDSLETIEDAYAFIQLRFPDNSFTKKDYYEDALRIADSLKISQWRKTDIDSNGFSDLVLFGSRTCVVLADKNGYKLKYLSKYGDFGIHDYFPTIENYDGSNIFIFRYKPYLRKSFNPLLIDTLIFKDGNFVEFQNAPVIKHDIEEIQIFSDGLCEGICPEYYIRINPKTKDSHGYKKFFWAYQNRNYKGPYKLWQWYTFTGHLTTLQIDSIHSLLNYADFVKFDVDAVNIMDAPHFTFIIRYDGGLIKTIEYQLSDHILILDAIWRIADGIEWK